MIIGVAGYKGSGKDTIANVLQTSFGFEKMSFAQPIKDIVHSTFGIDKAILSGDGGEREFREEVLPGWFYLSPRDMMQKIGMAFRDELHKDIWVKVLESKIKSIKQNIVIPDVRFKNELELINKYGTLEKLLKSAKEIKQNKRRETLIENKEEKTQKS